MLQPRGAAPQGETSPPQPKEHDSGSICEPPSAGVLGAARGLWDGSARLLLALCLRVQQLGAFWNAFSGGKLFINRLLNLLFPKAYGMLLVIEKLQFCLLVLQAYRFLSVCFAEVLQL